MNKKYILSTVAAIFISVCSFAQAKTDTIKVYGNCESCKDRIESAAKDAGATTADWNEKTKLLVVSYDAAATTNLKIQEKIASVGHDTQDVKAPEGSYKKLPGCCKYERKSAGKDAAKQKITKAGCCLPAEAGNSNCCAVKTAACC